jgi:hypothetical protein
MPLKKGNIRKEVSYSPSEWETVCKIASKLNMRPGTYIKKISLYGEINVFDMQAVNALIYEINKYGVNLNQIAHVINATNSVYQADVVVLQDSLEELEEKVDRYLSVLINEPLKI